MTLSAVDYFCGMGGSSSGLVEAGFEIKVAANHWSRAIETHSANHPDTEHLCADIQQVDIRYLPKADLLWASPICTELSQAGGRKKPRDHDQPGLWEEHGHVPAEAFERTRVTFWEVLRYAEVHNPPAVLVENVVEAADWHLLPTWLHGWETLGYRVQIVCVSAAHVGDEDNEPAPQYRERIYFGITRLDVPLLDLEPRPLAWCERCGHDVPARQKWKLGTKRVAGQYVGSYRAQYNYECPEGHGLIEPYVMPVAAAIDWTNLGTRIGDRKRPLGEKTMARIELGLRTISDPAFIAMSRNNGRCHPVSGAVPTWTGGGFHHGLTIPPDALTGAFISAHHGGYATGDPSMNKAITEPIRTITGRQNKSLVIPYRRGSKPYPATAAPLSTLATREQHGILRAALEVEDCHYRMLTPREGARCQRFRPDYVIHGNQGEQQMQAGNAVAVNVAAWLGRRAGDALGWGTTRRPHQTAA